MPLQSIERCQDRNSSTGGGSGCERFPEVLADPEHDDHKDMQRWCGGHFDSAWFNLGMVNKDLAQAFKRT
jgi:hypothetical protein